MQLVLQDVESQAPIILHPASMTDEQYFEFCQQHFDFRIERTAEGAIITGLRAQSKYSTRRKS